MTIITTTEAANLSANLAYKAGTYDATGRKFWHVWVRGHEDTGPHALVQPNKDGRTYRACRITRVAGEARHGEWLGAFPTRKFAAHAALVDNRN